MRTSKVIQSVIQGKTVRLPAGEQDDVYEVTKRERYNERIIANQKYLSSQDDKTRLAARQAIQVLQHLRDCPYRHSVHKQKDYEHLCAYNRSLFRSLLEHQSSKRHVPERTIRAKH